MNTIEFVGIQKIIKEWCGLDIALIDAGPSIADPCGIIDKYVSFRDSNNNAVAIGITKGVISSVQPTKDVKLNTSRI